MVSLQEFLAKLHPSFDDCPSPCARTADDDRPTDLPDFCAECDVRRQFDYFELGAKRELKRRFEPSEYPLSFEQLYADVRRIRRLDRSLRGRGYPPGCDTLTAQALDIWRNEEHRPVRIAAWEAAQRRRDGKP